MKHNFRDLGIWKDSFAIVKDVYDLCIQLPSEEKYGLKSQIQRCAISIPSNIAEGCGRKSDKELNQFLSISLGSAFELETQIILGYEFGHIDKVIYDNTIIQINEAQKMISGLQRSLSIQS